MASMLIYRPASRVRDLPFWFFRAVDSRRWRSDRTTKDTDRWMAEALGWLGEIRIL